jgi:hypothetical protein
MKNLTALLAATVAAIAPVAAIGADSPLNLTISQENAAKLPYTTLGTMASTPGQSFDDFLGDVGRALRAFSDRTKFEACGELASTPDKSRYGIVITTNKSHLGCVIRIGLIPDGMAQLGVTIHSHGGQGRFDMNRVDMKLAGVYDVASIMRIPISGENLYHFSPTDYAGGPGYLATPDGVIYQDGTPGKYTVVPVTGARVATR